MSDEHIVDKIYQLLSNPHADVDMDDILALAGMLRDPAVLPELLKIFISAIDVTIVELKEEPKFQLSAGDRKFLRRIKVSCD